MNIKQNIFLNKLMYLNLHKMKEGKKYFKVTGETFYNYLMWSFYN